MLREAPKLLTPDTFETSDVVITMGCGEECPYFPGKRYEDWELDDPKAKTARPFDASSTR